jgi:phosphoribosylglycinamide formyltransferase-1
LALEARKRTAVLVSGRGSNLEALIRAAEADTYPARIALVLSDGREAGGLDRAREHAIPAAVVEWGRSPGKAEFERDLDAALRDAGIELVCLAGFMRVLSAQFVEGWRDRILNIHPSLLPAFPGLNTHARALAAGVTEHGATVHFVRSDVDAGPIVLQGVVPVMAGDDAKTLAARVLTVEHRIYPIALRLVAAGTAQVIDERVMVPAWARPADPALRWPQA